MDVLLKLAIVPFTAVSDTIQSMLMSIELTGPSLLTESSSSLLTTITRERMKENPTHFNLTAEKIMTWLLGKWTPSKFTSRSISGIQLTSAGLWSERTYAATNAHHCNARDVLRLLYACLDLPSDLPKPSPFLVLGPISQARLWNARYQTLAQYLLGLRLRQRADKRVYKLLGGRLNGKPSTVLRIAETGNCRGDYAEVSDDTHHV